MHHVFSAVFASRCSDTLSHITPTPLISYNGICYMWWDVLPRHGVPARQDLRAIDEAILETLAKILSPDSVACKESALHGLGHWHVRYPEGVEGIIERFASRIPAELKQYARDARTGGIQ
jgi:hypothetical protein